MDVRSHAVSVNGDILPDLRLSGQAENVLKGKWIGFPKIKLNCFILQILTLDGSNKITS